MLFVTLLLFTTLAHGIVSPVRSYGSREAQKGLPSLVSDLATATPAPVAEDASAFPLILYDVPQEALAAVAATGFDTVHLYSSRQTLAQAKRYLQAAQAVGLQVVQNMPAAYRYREAAFWIEWVTTLAAYDNLAWWYLPEEPRVFDEQGMARLYDIVHQHDPQKRPVAVYFGTTHLARWCDVTDILLVPAYPEYHEAPRTVAVAWPDIARNACPHRRVVSVQTLFDTNFDGSGERPSPLQSRGDAYAAVIAGSRGLAWYSYERGKELPGLWTAVQEVVWEIKTLAPVLASSPISQTLQPQILSGPAHAPPFEDRIYLAVQTLQKEYGGVTYLLSANLAEVPLTVQFGGIPAGVEEVEVLFEERRLPVAGQAFVDRFLASEAHVYLIPAAPPK